MAFIPYNANQVNPEIQFAAPGSDRASAYITGDRFICFEPWGPFEACRARRLRKLRYTMSISRLDRRRKPRSPKPAWTPPEGMFVCSRCGRLWSWADLASFSKHPEVRLCENCVQARHRSQLERGDFVITLRPEPGEWDSPPIVRLRLLLKRALRVFRLRCVRLEFGTPTPALAERGHT